MQSQTNTKNQRRAERTARKLLGGRIVKLAIIGAVAGVLGASGGCHIHSGGGHHHGHHGGHCDW